MVAVLVAVVHEDSATEMIEGSVVAMVCYYYYGVQHHRHLPMVFRIADMAVATPPEPSVGTTCCSAVAVVATLGAERNNAPHRKLCKNALLEVDSLPDDPPKIRQHSRRTMVMAPDT